MGLTEREIFRKIGGIKDNYMVLGSVSEINPDKRTCTVTPKNGDADLHDVRLQALRGMSTGIVLMPKKGSDVVVGFLDEAEAVIVLSSTLDYVEIKTDTEIRLNGDSLGGIVNAKELKTQIDKNTAILNGILSILNGPPIPEPGNGAPSALQTSLKAAVSGKQTANLSNIENTKVKHG